MARIAGVDVPRDKRVVISLTYIENLCFFSPLKFLISFILHYI